MSPLSEVPGCLDSWSNTILDVFVSIFDEIY